MEKKEEILQYVIENGMLDLPDIEEQIEMNIRRKYLDMHEQKHKIWKGSNGKWCTYLPDKSSKNGLRLCIRKKREDVEDAVIEAWKQLEDNPTVREVFTEWNNRKLERKQIRHSSHTLHESTFDRFYKEFGRRKIKSITENEWEDFLCECITSNDLTAKGFSDLKCITKGFLKRAKKRGLIAMDVEHFFMELDVSDNDFKKRIIEEEKEVFFDDEAEKIMSYIKENQDIRNVGIALMFVTGIRIGELVALKHEDFDGTAFKIKRTMTRFKGEDGKYKNEISELPKTPAGYRTVFVPSDQKWILDKMRISNPFGEYIFVEDGLLLNTDKIRKRLYSICDKCDIPRKSPHKIRKTYGSILLDNGLDNKLIEGQMGHTSITCTERFYHRNRRRLQEKQNVFDSIPEFMSI